MMDFGARHPEAILDLATTNANGFGVMAATGRALRKAGVRGPEVHEFFRQAGAGDYDHVLRTMMAWVSITDSRDLFEDESA